MYSKTDDIDSELTIASYGKLLGSILLGIWSISQILPCFGFIGVLILFLIYHLLKKK